MSFVIQYIPFFHGKHRIFRPLRGFRSRAYPLHSTSFWCPSPPGGWHSRRSQCDSPPHCSAPPAGESLTQTGRSRPRWKNRAPVFSRRHLSPRRVPGWLPSPAASPQVRPHRLPRRRPFPPDRAPLLHCGWSVRTCRAVLFPESVHIPYPRHVLPRSRSPRSLPRLHSYSLYPRINLIDCVHHFVDVHLGAVH